MMEGEPGIKWRAAIDVIDLFALERSKQIGGPWISRHVFVLGADKVEERSELQVFVALHQDYSDNTRS